MRGNIPLSRACALMRSARDFPVDEICGFFLGDDWQVRFVENVADEPAKNFEMRHDQVRDLYNDCYGDLAGIFHSHPGGTKVPSQSDINNAPDLLRYFIVTADSVTEWKFRDDGTNPGQKSAELVDEVCYSAEAGRPSTYRPAGNGVPTV